MDSAPYLVGCGLAQGVIHQSQPTELVGRPPRFYTLELYYQFCHAGIMTTDIWDQIYTINKYYDGPELGVADYRGKPHIYERQFDTERDDYSERFLLSPIDPELLSLVLENWEIWLRWDSAYRQGNATIKTH